MLSINLLFTLINLLVINIKLAQDLPNNRVIKVVNPTHLFILSPLSFILKYDKDFQKIYHFLYLKGNLVNNYISVELLSLFYTLL